MESAISISEILGTIHDGRVEVCATADAAYDSAKERVLVKLEAFTRHVPTVGDDRRLPEPWLPPGEQVTENLPRDDVLSFSKEVFRSWIRKVRASVPGELHLRS